MDRSVGDLMFKISKIISSIADRVAKLETMAHAPRKFVTCEDCKQKIREIKDGEKKA
jgi:hypothetical protein